MRKPILAVCLVALAAVAVGCATPESAVSTTKIDTVSDSALQAECSGAAEYLYTEITRIGDSTDTINLLVESEVDELVRDTRRYITTARKIVTKCSEFLSYSERASFNNSIDSLEEAVTSLSDY